MSSPRQKTLVVASPQPNDLEQKKKRQTLERAKANHLSKQLQMRLQYAKLKVEHGWQRQNLNEVENLYFHHSHLRSIRQGAGQRPPYATATYPPPPPVLAEMPPAPDRTGGPSPPANDVALSDAVSPPSQSSSEHVPTADGRPPPNPPVQTPVPVVPSAFDLSDPNILARLAHLQAQVQIPSQPQSQSRQPPTTVPPTQPVPVPVPASVPNPIPGAFSPHVHLSQPPQPSFPSSTYAPQPPLGTPTSGSIPLYPTPAPHNPATPSQSPHPAHTPVPTAPPPATSIPIPTQTSIAPTALTYDSFWSSHASSTGSTRALYRTHTGFTTTAAPGGNVAMLTPGGHAAVLTSEGVYVGGASHRSS